MTCCNRIVHAIGSLALLVVVPAQAQFTSISKRLSQHEVEEYILWLRLDSDQTLLAREFYAQYVATRNGELLQVVRDYHNEAQDVVRRTNARNANRGVLSKELYPPLLRKQLRVQQRVDEVEKDFLEALRSILSAPQLQRWSRVANGRRRNLLFYREELPEGNVDLIRIVDGLALEPNTFNAIEQEWLMPFETQYVTSLLSLREAVIAQLKMHWEVYDLRYRRKFEATTDFERLALQREQEAAHERSGRARIAASERLVELNRRGLAEVTALLPADKAALLQRRYIETAYPQVHPDPASAATLYDLVESMEDLDKEQVEAFRALRAQWEFSHARLSGKMEKAVYDRYWSIYAGKASRRGNAQELWDVLRDLGSDREKLNQRQINLIMPLLNESQQSLLPEWDFHKNPPPGFRRRWDRDAERRWQDEDRERELQRIIDKAREEQSQQQQETSGG